MSEKPSALSVILKIMTGAFAVAIAAFVIFFGIHLYRSTIYDMFDEAYFTDDLWKRNAEHSNAMARQLYDAIKDEKGLDVVYPVQANGVFVRLPRQVWTELQKHYFFYDWDEDDNVVRFMCSFDTTAEDIDLFAHTLKELLSNHK